jgi:ABC-type multidrug transport system ATPase subunit
MVTRPRLLLLDEPLSNLDPELRCDLRRELVRIRGELDLTMLTSPTIVRTQKNLPIVWFACRPEVSTRLR